MASLVPEFRFFEIYRSQEYLALPGEGLLTSWLLTIGAGLLGFALAIVLSGVRQAAPYASQIRHIDICIV